MARLPLPQFMSCSFRSRVLRAKCLNQARSSQVDTSASRRACFWTHLTRTCLALPCPRQNQASRHRARCSLSRLWTLKRFRVCLRACLAYQRRFKFCQQARLDWSRLFRHPSDACAVCVNESTRACVLTTHFSTHNTHTHISR